MYDWVKAREAKLRGDKEPWRIKSWQLVLSVGILALFILYFQFCNLQIDFKG